MNEISPQRGHSYSQPLTPLDPHAELDLQFDISQQMIHVSWRPLSAALSQLLSKSIKEAQYQQLLSIYQTICRVCGHTTLIKPLTQFLM